MPRVVVDVCDDDGYQAERPEEKAGALPASSRLGRYGSVVSLALNPSFAAENRRAERGAVLRCTAVSK